VRFPSIKPAAERHAGAADRRRRKTGKKAAPTVAEQIVWAVEATRERRGLSLSALKKAMSANGYDVGRNNARVNQTVKRLVDKGSLVRVSGVGASGSFRLNRRHHTAAEEKKKQNASRWSALRRLDVFSLQPLSLSLSLSLTHPPHTPSPSCLL
uniref:H15 domain-containing protein n=1 Tax=Callorhinchus milii TaxID=7868 RepID=A0A4W3GZQ2_CALMI